jgi:hypothetical protein
VSGRASPHLQANRTIAAPISIGSAMVSSRSPARTRARLAILSGAAMLLALLTPAAAGAAVSAVHPTHDGGVSTVAIVVAIIAALLALACAAWGLASMQAFEPRWTLSLRHAVAEAGFRASAAWAEFSDWARLGH